MTSMKAMVYYGENDIRFEDRPVPTLLHPGDAIIKLEKSRFVVPISGYGKVKPGN